MMKSLKTYNIDIDVVRILSKKPNKSQFVCRAVRKLDKGDGTSLQDYTNQQLIGALQSRFDQYSPQYQMLTTLIALL